MIEQLPIINLLVLLSTALVIPLFKKRTFNMTLWFGFIMLLFVFISSIVLTYHVYTYGAFYYHMGGHAPFIGIELLIDGFATFFTTFVLGLLLLIYSYSAGDATEGISEKEYGRYYILLFILLFAMLGIVYTNDLFNIYVFMEILSITTCSIISIKRKKENYTSAFRYVMLNEVGSLSFLFGVALIYMITGFTNIGLIANALPDVWALYPANIILAVGFMIIGLGIKSAIFPFHVWLPDAHASAPSSSSAILSGIVIKVYVLIFAKILFRLYGVALLEELNIPIILTILASVGMIMGSMFAMAQKDIKRMLGYSSVAQMGYIVLGISLFSYLGLRAAFFHITSHALLKSALFLSVGAVIYKQKERRLNRYDGMGKLMPLSMGVFAIASLGMIGIPITSGFISKYNLGLAALDANQTILIGVLVLSGLLNAMYYLPILIQAFLKEPKTPVYLIKLEKIPLTMMLPVAVLGLAILFLGIYPHLVLNLVDFAVESLGF